MTVRIDGTNTAANPGITGTDTDTGLSFGTNEVSINTDGTERFRVGSAGQFGIGGATYGTSGQFLQSQGSGSAPQWATPASATWTMANVGAGPGGGVVAFTSLPSDMDMFIMSWNELDSNNDASYRIELGTSSGYATSGYITSSGYIPSPVVSRSTSAFHFEGSGGSGNFYGQMIFTRHGSSTSNSWHGTGMAHFHNSDVVYNTSGYVALPSTIDRARIMVSSGGLATQGSVTLQYLRT